MTISRRKGCPDILRTDCRNDQGMETAWKQVTQVIENGMKPEDIEKMVSKLTKAARIAIKQPTMEKWLSH